MRAPLPHVRDFTEALTNADVSVTKLVPDDNGTIGALSDPDPTALVSPALVTLAGNDQAEIVVKETLSRGGMGQILLAEQRSLGRAVAVKVASASDAHAEAQLVVEARVAGQLDHPNILPVYILGMAADGKPLMVMKRIEGDSWKDLLLDRRRPLARDVAILMDVCRAIHFAHARGVVHRDVKPANVMVGKFGEVYLLDWGIAVGFGDASPELPRASDVTRPAGTPQYMAPEMALPAGAIDARTDVYLLGAVLYELITRHAPHRGGTVEEILYKAHVAAPPEFDDDVPEELAEICRNAMKRDPRERYQSADELRDALAAWQSHAAARELCQAAEDRLATLLAGGDDREAQRAFTECRFGFSLALRTWPQSVRAREGLERAVASMAWREAEAGHYDSARLLAAELEPAPPALTALLDELSQRRDAAAADVVQLQQIKHERDVTIGSRERAVMILAAATGWLLMLVAMHVLDRRGVYSAQSGTFAIVMSSIVAAVAAFGVVAPRIRSTAASRAIYLTLLVCVVGITTVHIAGWWFQLPPAAMLAMGHTVLAASLLTVAAQDGRLWLGAGLTGAIVPAILAWPAQAYLVSGVGCFCALAVLARSLRERA